jgi:hypothetical protein
MIGRYEVVSALGQGGFGITYRARDSQLGREVAIKEYLPLALAVRQDGTTVLPRSTSAAEDFTWGRGKGQGRGCCQGRTSADAAAGRRAAAHRSAERGFFRAAVRA